MAGPKLQLRLKQQLAMAPQLQQAIKLLQLNRLELRQHVEQILEANPLLERQDLAEQEWDSEAPETESSQEEFEQGESEFDSEEFDSEWDLADGFSITSGGGEGGGDFSDRIAEDAGSLQDHLLWQINLSPLSESDQAIATAIVFALDQDGYLNDSIADIQQSLAPDLLVEEEEVLAVLHRIQRMEPVGVATRSPGECLAVQLETLPADIPGRDLAKRLARDHLEDLASGRRERLQKFLNVDAGQLDEALELLQSMEPRPGARFDNRRDEYLAPDVYIRHKDGEWVVSLNPDNDPNLQLSGYYMKLLKSARGDDASYLKGRLQEARWLLSSLELRNRTLLSVTRAIVARQSDFLERGDKGLRPLVLREIAEDTGLHESTISRATTRKYVLTPRGLLELKYFFSSQVKTMDGAGISATAVKAHIQELIQREDPESPLSDAALTEALEARDIRVARRTVAKYRDSLGIGSSTARRRASRRLKAFRVGD